MTDQLITVGELAKLLDMTPQRVRQLVKEEVIPKAKRGGYPIRACVNAYINWLRERAVVSAGDYREQKARLTKAQADAAEIDLAKKRGELAPVEDFEKATEAIMRTIRNNMMNIPQRAITRLLGETEEARFKDVLKDEIVQALTVTAGTEIEDDA